MPSVREMLKLHNVDVQDGVDLIHHVCDDCGYTFELGSTAPNNVWEETPEDYVCPHCNNAKANFKTITI